MHPIAKRQGALKRALKVSIKRFAFQSSYKRFLYASFSFYNLPLSGRNKKELTKNSKHRASMSAIQFLRTPGRRASWGSCHSANKEWCNNQPLLGSTIRLCSLNCALPGTCGSPRHIYVSTLANPHHRNSRRKTTSCGKRGFISGSAVGCPMQNPQTGKT